MSDLRPTAEQEAAITSRDRDVLLAAGAGTGKTRVLAERYVGAVLDLAAEGAESPADAILAFTFTDRAAAELRERIRATLLRRADDADTDQARMLRRTAAGLSRAWISTIHGFCRRLLAAHPTRLGLDPRFRVLEAGEADRLAGDAFERGLERFLAGGGPERARLLAVFGVRSLREAILAIHAEMRSQGQEPELPQAPDPDPRTALEGLRDAAAVAAEECREAGGAKADEYRRRIDAAANLAAEPLPASAGVAALVLDSKAAAFTGPCATAYESAVERAVRALVEAETREEYEGLRELLRGFAAVYEELKEERSGLDFEDLQLEAVRLLRDHEDLRDRYRERFRHLMVDEFQDTNLLQLQLIDLLRSDDTRMFAVGDELQAIYGFRHADVEVFRAVRRRMAEDSESVVLPLSGNFRSAPGVLAAINALGGTLLGEEFEPLTVGAESQHRAFPVAGPDAELLVVPAKSKGLWSEREAELELAYEGDNAPAAWRVAEARMLAARLRDLADSGVPQREMVILLRAATPVPAIEQELRRAGLDPYVVGGRGYWQQQQVEDLRRFLGAIANPLEDLGLLGLLASPAGGVSPDALWLLRQAAGGGRFWPALQQLFGNGDGEPDEESASWAAKIPAHDAELLRGVCTRFEKLRGEAPLLPLDELIDRVVTDFGYDLAVLMREDGERRTANIRKLMGMARAFESVEGRDLRGFLDHLDERADGAGEGEAAVEAEGREVVRIMTVHAAKGLEFPVVAFADLGRGLLEGAFPPALRVGRTAPSEKDGETEAAAARVGVRMARFGASRTPIFDYAELAEEADSEAAHEALRIAHVAITRAESHLILSGRVSPSALDREEPATGASVIERLLRAWDVKLSGEEPDDGEEPAGASLEVGPSISLTIARPTPEWGESVRRVGRVAAAATDRAPAAPLVRAASPPPAVLPSRLSYTSIAQFEECAFRFYTERVLGLPEDAGRPGAEGSDRARRLGSAVHLLLEWSARNEWAQPDAERVAAALEREELGATSAERELCAGLVERWSQTALRAELDRDCGSIRPETGFTLAVEGAVVGGQIDLLGDRGDRGPLVVDYKTNRLDGADPRSVVEERYAVQRDIYALAAAGDSERAETVFVFLERPEAPVRDEFGPLELAAARQRLERAVAEIRAGEFEASHEPSEALCSGCPARAGLCPRWRWQEGELLQDAA